MSTVFVSDAGSFIGERIVRTLKTQAAVGVIKGSYRKSDEQHPKVSTTQALDAALSSDVIVLNLHTAVDEAVAVAEVLQARVLADHRLSRTVIAVSSALTWDSPASAGVAVHETDWKAYRSQAPGVAAAVAVEAKLLSLLRPDRVHLRVHVVSAGLVYGEGEGPLFELFASAWRCGGGSGLLPPPLVPGVAAEEAGTTALAIPQHRSLTGSNAVPCIHVADLATIVSKLVQLPPPTAAWSPKPGGGPPLPVVVAADDGSATAADVVKAIAEWIGDGSTTSETAEAIASQERTGKRPQLPVLGHDYSRATSAASMRALAPAYLAADVHFATDSLAAHTHPALALGPSQLRCREGFLPHMPTVALEFARARGCQPLRIMVTGPPAAGKSTAAAAISRRYQLPLITLPAALALIRSGDLSTLATNPARLAALTSLRSAVEMALMEAAAAAQEASIAAAAAAPAAAKGGKAAPAPAPAKGKGAPAPAPAAAPAVEEPAYNRPPRLPVALTSRIIRAVLESPVCRNRGWVLDGYPRTFNEATALFAAPSGDGTDPIAPPAAPVAKGAGAAEEAAEDEEALAAFLAANVALPAAVPPPAAPPATPASLEPPPEVPLQRNLLPTCVVRIDAPDEVLQQRIAAIPAAAVPGTHNTKEQLARRLRRTRLHDHDVEEIPKSLTGFFKDHAVVPILRLPVAELAAACDVACGAVAAAAEPAASTDGVPAAPAPPSYQLRVTDAAAAPVEAALAAAAAASAVLPEPLPAAALLPEDLPTPAARSVALQLVNTLSLVAETLKTARVVPSGSMTFTEQQKTAIAAIAAQRAAKAAAAEQSSGAGESKAEEGETAAAAAPSAEGDVTGLDLSSAADLADDADVAAKQERVGKAEGLLLDKRTAGKRAQVIAHAFPHLLTGVLEVAATAPAQPVDALAESLLRRVV